MAYHQLSVEERQEIYLGIVHKESLRVIAARLGRPPSTISREVRRNIPGRMQYTPHFAEERARRYRTHRGRQERLKNGPVRAYVTAKLKGGYSPEQIAGRIRIDLKETISHEAIYQYIYAAVHRDGYGYLRPGHEDLRPCLKRRHKRRVSKGLRGTQRVQRYQGRSIDLRPLVVKRRTHLGHWEGDSVVSKKSAAALNTLVERTSGLVCITRIRDGSAEATREAVIQRLSALPVSKRRTLTVDNGRENAFWRQIEAALPGMRTYFAHPYHSWERGTNENTNGLLRWYFPKGTDFAKVSDDEIARVEYALNHRPRKRLKWKTPVEVFPDGVALTC